MSLSHLFPSHLADSKRLGDHLLEAGLINPYQLEVAIHDQHATGLRLGEIVVARGWVKEDIMEDLANRLTETAQKSVRSIKYKPSFSARSARAA
jgi:hypothetical protein